MLVRLFELAQALLRKTYWQQTGGIFELVQDLTLMLEESVVEGVSDVGYRNSQQYEKWFV